MRYHHLGMPTTEAREGEIYLPQFKMHVCPYDGNPYRIEWMRFEPDCELPELVQTVPHLAFVVDDLQAALEGREILIEPNSPSPGLEVALVVSDGAPVELMQFTDPGHPDASTELVVGSEAE
jgi:hypothetical protein